MRRHTYFWPLVLIVVGAVLLLDNLQVFAPLHISAWAVIWPLIIIAIGVRILLRTASPRRTFTGEQVAIPLATLGSAQPAAPALQTASAPTPAGAQPATEQAAIPLAAARRARIHIQHGAGRLEVRAGAPAGQILSGSFKGGLDYRTSLEGDMLAVQMHVPSSISPIVGPWNWGESLDWSFGLNGEIPLALELETGANETHLDLTDLLVTELRLKTGASATEVQLPAHAGQTQVRVEAGVASVNLRVPAGVAARIRLEGALSGNGVDAIRFPRQGDCYQSVGYDTAANKVDIHVESALGSVDVR